MSSCCGGHSKEKVSHHDHSKMGHGKIIKDPVCGMTVDPETAKGGSSTFQGQTFYFCSSKCKSKFDSEPQSFLTPKAPTKDMKDVEFTCPMHPEIRQKGPGNCPIC